MTRRRRRPPLHRRWCALLALLLVGPLPAHAQALSGDVDYPTRGIAFRVPDGWVGQETDAGIVLGSYSEAGLILMTRHDYGSLEEMRLAADQGIVDVGLSLRRDGDVRQASDDVIGASFSGVYEGQPARAWAAGVLNPHGSGVSVLALTTADAWTETLAERARALAASVTFRAPDFSSLVAEWRTFLSDVRLTYLDSDYSSGPSVGGYLTGSGYSTERLLHLCAAGHYRYSSSSSLSIDTGGAFASDAGRDRGAGRWEIAVDTDGQPLLRLSAHDGGVRDVRLGYENGKTFLDGTRYFRTTPGDTNGYAPLCP